MTRIVQRGGAINEVLANLLVEEGLRAPIVRRMTHVPQTSLSEYFKQHHGRNSPSGLMPTNLLWFVDSFEASKHAALLILIYRQVANQVKRRATPATSWETIEAIAFGRSLAFYNRDVCGNAPLISPERAYLLIKHFADRGARNGQSADGIKLMRCRCCRLPMVTKSHYREITCETCRTPRDDSNLH